MSPDNKPHHPIELGNEFKCDRLVNQWLNAASPSAQIIPLMHKQLMEGNSDYSRKGLIPIEPGTYRNIDIRSEGQEVSPYVYGLDVAPIMATYTKDLDQFLETLPRNPVGNMKTIVEGAARYYYAFERIHPYLDGNGRLGRKILKRILKGGGIKDLIFRSDLGKGRNAHLDALKAVDKSGNLAYLEVYLLDQISLRYMGESNQSLHTEIERLRAKKIENIKSQKFPYSPSDIWRGFEQANLSKL